MAPVSSAEILSLSIPSRLALCLPEFAGGALASAPNAAYRYSGVSYAERDVRAAEHFLSVALPAGADVQHLSPAAVLDALESDVTPFTLVLVGSRSNEALGEVMIRMELGNLAWFTFDSQWSIHTRSGSRYSIPDPSLLDQRQYEAATDFGLIAGGLFRARHRVLVLAGLGGRATEGCGLYLRSQWDALARRTMSRSFAAVLRFDPPFNPAGAEMVELLMASVP
jgi:hypothetical protein